jgi:hypothetical protein
MMRALLAMALAACSTVPDAGRVPGAPVRPARVVTVVYVADPDRHASFEQALDLWNDAAGREVLVEVDVLDPDAGVVITDGEVAGERLGSASLDGRIRLHRPADPYVSYLVLAHELGHAAFGLAHDPDHGCSIMAPDIAGAVIEGWRGPDAIRGRWPAFRPVCVTEGDARIARGGG